MAAMDHAAIIDALGGARSVANALGVNRSEPYRWAERGIPGHRWKSVVALAEHLGIWSVTADLLMAGAPARKPRPRRRKAGTPAAQMLAGE
jgi:hypothetical protein